MHTPRFEIRVMSNTLSVPFKALNRLGLIPQIVIGILLGIIVATLSPDLAASVSLLGQVFISALKAVAPVLVFVLVMAAIANHQRGRQTQIHSVLMLYLAGTLVAALVAVTASFLFPTELTLDTAQASGNPPGGVIEILRNLLLSAVANPVAALMEANFVAILVWAISLGLVLRNAQSATKGMINDLSDAVSTLVRWVIRLAPLGIFGLVAGTLAEARHRRTDGIWPPVVRHRRLHGIRGAGHEPLDRLPDHPQEPLPSGIQLPSR